MKNAYLLEDNGDFILIGEDNSGSGVYTDTRYVYVVQRNQDIGYIRNGIKFFINSNNPAY